MDTPLATGILSVLAIVAIVVIWEIAALQVGKIYILPDPVRVVKEFCAEFAYDPGLVYLGIKTPSYGLNIAWTVGLALASWVIGGVLGLVIGLRAAGVQWVRNIVGPVFYVFGAVPALVLAPFATLWFGFGPAVEIGIVGFYCFITVGIIALSAGLNFDQSSEEYAATLGLSSWKLFWSVIFRGTLPETLVGMRIALAMSIAVQVTLELLGSQYGVGRIISVRASEGNVSAVLGMVIAMGLIALMFDVVCRVVSRHMTKWRGE